MPLSLDICKSLYYKPTTVDVLKPSGLSTILDAYFITCFKERALHS